MSLNSHIFTRGVHRKVSGKYKRKYYLPRIHPACMVSDNFANQIRKEVTVKRALEKFLGAIIYKRSGRDYLLVCPFCEEEARLSTKKNIFKCFSCGAGANNCISLLQHYRGFEFHEAARFIANRCHIKDIEENARRQNSIRDESLPF